MRPRRVLMLLSTLCAEGTPVLALDLARRWMAQGIGVEVATFFDEPAEMRGEYEREGVPLHRFSIERAGQRKFWELGAKAYGLCRRLRPDAVLCFPFGWHGYVAWGAALAGNRRLVAHAGNYPPAGSRGACRKLAVSAWLGVPFGAKVACCSDYVLGGVREHLRLPGAALRTIHNGIRLEAFSARPAANGSHGPAAARSWMPVRSGMPLSYGDARYGDARYGMPVRCGMVARLEGHKDQPTLIRAAALLRERGVDVRVELAGEGSRRAELEALIGETGTGGSVSLLGTRRDIAGLLGSWDLFVFSVTGAEGLGISLIEALAAGVPVIASDVGACREVLCPPGQEPLGELAPAGSAEAIADAVERFTRNREAWRARAWRARESARQRFSIEAMAEAYLRILGLASPQEISRS